MPNFVLILYFHYAVRHSPMEPIASALCIPCCILASSCYGTAMPSRSRLCIRTFNSLLLLRSLLASTLNRIGRDTPLVCPYPVVIGRNSQTGVSRSMLPPSTLLPIRLPLVLCAAGSLLSQRRQRLAFSYANLTMAPGSFLA